MDLNNVKIIIFKLHEFRLKSFLRVLGVNNYEDYSCLISIDEKTSTIEVRRNLNVEMSAIARKITKMLQQGIDFLIYPVFDEFNIYQEPHEITDRSPSNKKWVDFYNTYWENFLNKSEELPPQLLPACFRDV